MSWTLTRFTEPYAINPHAEKICILIPGWGVGSDIFEWLRPALSQDFIVYQADPNGYASMLSPTRVAYELQAQIEQDIFSEHGQQSCCVIGWSLGGNIALQLALDFPQTVSSLLLLATSPSFLAREHWPLAMDAKTYGLFQQGIQKQAAKTLKRFDLLQCKGDDKKQSLSHALSSYRKQQIPLADDELAAGLELLADFDQCQRLHELRMPVQWCLGAEDALVDAAIATPLSALIAQLNVTVLEGVAHLPFLTATDAVFEILKHLMAEVGAEQGKSDERKKIAASFSKAASSYDDSAAVQKLVAEHLLSFMPKHKNITVLDAGCGTGFWSRRISENADQVIGLDLAHGMLAFADQHSDKANLTFCGGDLEKLPLADSSVDVIFSSLAVQWCESLSLLLAEWQRVLKPGGEVCMATLGPQTLYELRKSFESVDDAPHVNQFIASDILCEQVNQSALTLLQLKNDKQVMRYHSMRDLMADLKNIGAQTVLHKKDHGLMGKARFKKANQSYEGFRDAAGFLPATYDVIYLHLKKS